MSCFVDYEILSVCRRPSLHNRHLDLIITYLLLEVNWFFVAVLCFSFTHPIKTTRNNSVALFYSSLRCLCVSKPNLATHIRCKSHQFFTLPLRHSSMMNNSIAFLCSAIPLLRATVPNNAFPLLCVTLLCYSVALLCFSPQFLCYTILFTTILHHSLANLFPSESSVTGVVPLPDTI